VRRKTYGGIGDFKKGYQPRTNIVKDEKSIWLQIAAVFWLGGGNISQLLNVHGVSDVRQTELHTAEPLVPEPSAFETEMVIEKLKRDKSPGIDQTPGN
jgi:hypothetical protein